MSLDPQTLHRAEMVVRTMLGQVPTPRAIAQALADANLLRPGNVPKVGVIAGLETALGLAEGDELTIWRAEHWHEITPLGHYLTKAAAEAHCARNAGREPDLDGQPLRWIQDGPDPSDDDPTFLFSIAINDGEVDTGYSVRPITVAAAFDPEAAE